MCAARGCSGAAAPAPAAAAPGPPSPALLGPSGVDSGVRASLDGGGNGPAGGLAGAMADRSREASAAAGPPGSRLPPLRAMMMPAGPNQAGEDQGVEVAVPMAAPPPMLSSSMVDISSGVAIAPPPPPPPPPPPAAAAADGGMGGGTEVGSAGVAAADGGTLRGRAPNKPPPRPALGAPGVTLPPPAANADPGGSGTPLPGMRARRRAGKGRPELTAPPGAAAPGAVVTNAPAAAAVPGAGSITAAPLLLPLLVDASRPAAAAAMPGDVMCRRMAGVMGDGSGDNPRPPKPLPLPPPPPPPSAALKHSAPRPCHGRPLSALRPRPRAAPAVEASAGRRFTPECGASNDAPPGAAAVVAAVAAAGTATGGVAYSAAGSGARPSRASASNALQQ